MTSHANRINQELPRWPSFRMINFFYPPFSLPAPMCIAKDTGEKDMYIIMYDLKKLPL